jgi:acetylornithine/N-succinyldiaminopimelate aminotransferase
VWDDAGRPYTDMYAGIAVSALGHAHPALVEAVRGQVATLAHTSNLFINGPALELAERLAQLLGGGKAFLCNDGTEANEAALKLARRHGRSLDPSGGRLEVVAAEHGFHGRTMGSLSLTGTPSKRAPFEPLPGAVCFVPYGDAEALAAAVTERTAAVFLEPTLGEGGVVPPPEGYLAAARAACDAVGALLVVDEVQSGIGRTGHWFAHQQDRVQPDVVTLAKGLGGGMPIGACVAFGAAAELFHKGDHGSTFGGNPVSCAAALAVLRTIEDHGLLSRATALGERLASGVLALHHPLVAGVRGRGLWLGIVLHGDHAGAAERHLRAAGYLVNVVQPHVLRLAPPLVLTDGEADAFLAALPLALDEVAAAVVRPTRVPA